MNYPYRGTADGLPTTLRRAHPDARYAGIEIEVNQRFPRRGGAAWARLRRILASSLVRALERGAIRPLPRRAPARQDEGRPSGKEKK
jgi:hypothetical protein